MTTPTTDPTDEPAAASTPSGSATPEPQPSSNDPASTRQPATTEPAEQDETTEQTSSDESDGGQSEPTSGLVQQIESLPVAADDRSGYDRDDFGDYDRDALLDASMSEHGCFLSLADNQCHDDAGEVHVDHIVALSEAWESGLAKSDTDAIAADPDNLWLMTAAENMSKSDDDPAAWLPPHDDAICTYIERYISIKIEYELTVDPANGTRSLAPPPNADGRGQHERCQHIRTGGARSAQLLEIE